MSAPRRDPSRKLKHESKREKLKEQEGGGSDARPPSSPWSRREWSRCFGSAKLGRHRASAPAQPRVAGPRLGYALLIRMGNVEGSSDDAEGLLRVVNQVEAEGEV